MKRGYQSRRIYAVRCQSGLMGWRTRLKNNYDSFTEFCRFDVAWGIVNRIGYKSAAAAWAANPVIEGSPNPFDFRKVAP